MAIEPSKARAKEFMDKVNEDPVFRNKFLNDPVGTLKEAGIKLTPTDEKEVEYSVGYLRDDLKHIFEIPTGSGDFLHDLGFTIQMPPRIKVKPDTRNV